MQPTPTPEYPSARRFGVLARQLPFAVVHGVLVVVLALWQEGEAMLPDPVLVAVGITFVATVMAAAVPWATLPEWAPAAVPLLDMAAVVCLLSAGARASVLIVLPVLWLARMGYAWTVTAIVSGVLSSMGVDIVDFLRDGRLAITPDNAARLFIVPAVTTAAALNLHLSEKRSAARRELLAGQSALVEEALEETSKERGYLVGVLNTIDTAVAVLDREGTVVVANRALHEAGAGTITEGVPLAAAAPRLYGADGVTPVSAERLTAVARGDYVDRRVVWWELDDGDRSAFRVSAGPLAGDDGLPAGSVIALHDITDELAALAQREDFVSSVSHELRTPLTSVAGYLDLAVDDPELPEHVRGYLEVAERNAARLRILIDNLLTAARTRADAGSWEAVDLGEVVADVVESQRPRAVDRDITIAVTAEGRTIARGDTGRLTQVVDNLVSNAVKYTRHGGHVDIRLRVEDSRVCLAVSDDGPGISAEAQSQIFSRFYRAPEVRNSPVQGTGLGLHISRQIVEALGGSITLSSEPGSGTSVEVALPVMEGP